MSKNDVADMLQTIRLLKISRETLKVAIHTIVIKSRKQRSVFISMLLVALGASLLGNLLSS